MKKNALKSCSQSAPNFFYVLTVPAAKTAERQKSHTIKSPLMQDRVFRLGPFIKLDILSKNPISVNHEEVVFGFSLQRLLIKENFFLLPPPKLLWQLNLELLQKEVAHDHNNGVKAFMD